VPRAVAAFRVDDGRDPATLHVEQALRHRIMRGNTVVEDLGWRLAPFTGAYGSPGKPVTEVLGNVLIAPRIEPSINRAAPGFDQLRDMHQIDLEAAIAR